MANKRQFNNSGGLVLERKYGESITIETADGLIDIQVIADCKKICRVKISAPKTVKIQRTEVYMAKKLERV